MDHNYGSDLFGVTNFVLREVSAAGLQQIATAASLHEPSQSWVQCKLQTSAAPPVDLCFPLSTQQGLHSHLGHWPGWFLPTAALFFAQATDTDYVSKVAWLADVPLEKFMMDNAPYVKDLEASLGNVNLLVCRNPQPGEPQ